jgi:peptidoglycan/xylan/chitin deacetylase (PgdA/CDA1 family)
MSRQARSLAVKQAVKNCVYASLGAVTKFSGAAWVREKLRRHDAVLSILMYHKINRTRGNSLSVSPERFKTQLTYLNSHYSVISPSQLLAAVRQGDPLPPRAVLLTFDDGYRDNREFAYPILQDLGLKALLFVSADFVGGARPMPHDEALHVANPLLSWSQLLEMNDVFTIGSHARSHRVLTGLPREEAEHEIESSKVIIEEHLGRDVPFFSYPKGASGDYDEALERKVKASGYDVSFVTIPGANTWGRLRSGSGLRRYNVEPFSTFTFALMVEGSCDLVRLKETPVGQRSKRALNHLLRTNLD